MCRLYDHIGYWTEVAVVVGVSILSPQNKTQTRACSGYIYILSPNESTEGTAMVIPKRLKTKGSYYKHIGMFTYKIPMLLSAQLTFCFRFSKLRNLLLSFIHQPTENSSICSNSTSSTIAYIFSTLQLKPMKISTF